VALGLLLGGALGNMLDRLRLGYVLDFVDVGIGDLRFYTFNAADSAISCAIVLLLLSAVLPGRFVLDRLDRRRPRGGPAGPVDA
jgi:signal peptidase II